jgi:hypothetical protein
MTESDCERVGRHLRTVWDAETAATAPEPNVQKDERAKLVINGEGERVANEWMAECRREIAGRRVDDKEVDCLLAAKTFEDWKKCANAR